MAGRVGRDGAKHERHESERVEGRPKPRETGHLRPPRLDHCDVTKTRRCVAVDHRHMQATVAHGMRPRIRQAMRRANGPTGQRQQTGVLYCTERLEKSKWAALLTSPAPPIGGGTSRHAPETARWTTPGGRARR